MGPASHGDPARLCSRALRASLRDTRALSVRMVAPGGHGVGGRWAHGSLAPRWDRSLCGSCGRLSSRGHHLRPPLRGCQARWRRELKRPFDPILRRCNSSGTGGAHGAPRGGARRQLACLAPPPGAVGQSAKRVCIQALGHGCASIQRIRGPDRRKNSGCCCQMSMRGAYHRGRAPRHHFRTGRRNASPTASAPGQKERHRYVRCSGPRQQVFENSAEWFARSEPLGHPMELIAAAVAAGESFRRPRIFAGPAASPRTRGRPPTYAGSAAQYSMSNVSRVSRRATPPLAFRRRRYQLRGAFRRRRSRSHSCRIRSGVRPCSMPRLCRVRPRRCPS